MVENCGYTELVHAGEGITIEKGKISAAGSGGVNIIPLEKTDEYMRFQADAISNTDINILYYSDPDIRCAWYIVTNIDVADDFVGVFTVYDGVEMSLYTFDLLNGYYTYYLR